jgi:Mismatch repair ATPase (MutS family)
MKQLSMLPENDIYYAQKQLFERIPTAIIITHFKEIFLRNLVQEDYLIRFFTMEAMLKNENNHYAFVRSLKYINQDQPQNPYLNYVPMNEAIKVDDLRPENKVLFLYRVKPGYSINSFALFCAKQVGFSPELLKRINEIQNTTLEKVEPNKQIIEKYEQATRDILYRLNDIFISLKNPKIE